MKRNIWFLLIVIFSVSCSEKSDKDDPMISILSEIIDQEMKNIRSKKEDVSIFFLQNAECKCAASTLDKIHEMSFKGDQKVVVVVNNKDHFSIPQLADSDIELKYLSVNDLISYGFFQSEDLLVNIKNSKVEYQKL